MNLYISKRTFQYCSPQPSTRSNMHVEKIKKTQIARASFSGCSSRNYNTPFIHLSLRSANLSSILSIIIAVAAEAGLFFFFVSAGNEKIAALSVVLQQPIIISGRVFPYCKEKMDGANKPHQSAMVIQFVEKCSSDKVFGAVDDQVHRDPSIFFIGGTGERDTTEARYFEDHDGGGEVGEVISVQELFQKSEIFIGNFYKQLSVQMEESWKKLHDDFSQKTLIVTKHA